MSENGDFNLKVGHRSLLTQVTCMFGTSYYWTPVKSNVTEFKKKIDEFCGLNWKWFYSSFPLIEGCKSSKIYCAFRLPNIACGVYSRRDKFLQKYFIEVHNIFLFLRVQLDKDELFCNGERIWHKFGKYSYNSMFLGMRCYTILGSRVEERS